MEDNKQDMQQETEIVKAVKEELSAQMEALKANYENTINTMRTEHAKQLREILRTGNAANVDLNNEPDDEDEDEDGISRKAVKRQIDLLNKRMQRF